MYEHQTIRISDFPPVPVRFSIYDLAESITEAAVPSEDLWFDDSDVDPRRADWLAKLLIEARCAIYNFVVGHLDSHLAGLVETHGYTQYLEPRELQIVLQSVARRLQLKDDLAQTVCDLWGEVVGHDEICEVNLPTPMLCGLEGQYLLLSFHRLDGVVASLEFDEES